MILGKGEIFFDKGDGKWDFLGRADAMEWSEKMLNPIAKMRQVEIQFRGLTFASEETRQIFEWIASRLRKQPHWRSPARPFFPRRRGRSMRGK